MKNDKEKIANYIHHIFKSTYIEGNSMCSQLEHVKQLGQLVKII
jgi:hypothetical protein